MLKLSCLGHPSLRSSEPDASDDFSRVVAERASTFFYVEALTHPAAQFQWKRVFNNGSHVDLPSIDKETSSNLTFNDVTMHDFGNYSVSAFNSIGRWEDIEFKLLAISE
jgi:hypothetical protein